MTSAAASVKAALKQTYLRIKSAAIVERNHDLGQTVFLAGDARSGTTWLSDLINHDNAYRYMFEPFGKRQLGEFWYGSYLRPDDADPSLRALAQDVLSGRLRDPWVDQFNRRLLVQRRLVKEVRANLWIKWLRVQFPEIPTIFLIRHPIPTVRSRFKRYFDAKDKAAIDVDPQGRTRDYKHYLLGQPALVADHIAPFAREIESAVDVYDQRLFTWAVQNFVPLRQLASGDAHVVFYEHLVMDPAGEMQRLFAFLNRTAGDAPLRNVWKPSAMSRFKEVPDPLKLVNGWVDKVPAADVSRAGEILGLFGLDKIYSADPMPVSGGLARFRAGL